MTKILLVEDDKSLREIYGVRLQAEGYEIVSAGDGEEALAMAIKERPQLILSDVMMPNISGFDMLDILRSTTETKDIKVIMMTALSSEDQRERGESLGADKYLVKSQVGIEDVVRTVHEVLGDTPAAASAGNVFAQPAGPRTSIPTANMQPAAPSPQPQAAPQAPSQPQPAAPQPSQPTQPQSPPQAPAPAQQPAAPQQPQPVQQPQPQAPAAPSTPPSRLPADSAPSPTQNTAPQESTLPRPTAPFSTDRPAGLGDRIIHPIEQSADNKRDLSALMAQELNSVPTDQPTAPQSQTPQPSAAPQAPSQPQPAAPQPIQQPQSPPQAPAPAQQPAAPQQPQPAQQPQPQAPAAPSTPPTPPQQP